MDCQKHDDGDGLRNLIKLGMVLNALLMLSNVLLGVALILIALGKI